MPAPLRVIRDRDDRPVTAPQRSKDLVVGRVRVERVDDREAVAERDRVDLERMLRYDVGIPLPEMPVELLER
jgi:hypothetical protein